ncbi:hypothetical protein NDN08_000909 [Rhodosorus marinus]|uniref:Uncharacterized protein n=1 Tax=Rhodosorus marinus TaxID=101924 RepID=A0AAV8UPB7_9RHOD|nr:hypothetical protein NDN08_000909 [Rhodosorus marinus]
MGEDPAKGGGDIGGADGAGGDSAQQGGAGGYPPLDANYATYNAGADGKEGYPTVDTSVGAQVPSTTGGYGASNQGTGYPVGTGYPAINPTGYPGADQATGYPPANQATGYPPANQPTGYPPAGQETVYPEANQATGYPPVGEEGGYPASGAAAGYPAQPQVYPNYANLGYGDTAAVGTGGYETKAIPGQTAVDPSLYYKDEIAPESGVNDGDLEEKGGVSVKPAGGAGAAAGAFFVAAPPEAYTYQQATNTEFGKGAPAPGTVDIESGQPENEVNISHSGVRNAFLRKVFAIVTIQILITTGISLMCVYIVPLREFCADNWWIWLVFFFAAMICLFILQWKRHKHPQNLVWLGIFTVIMSFFVGTICATYADNGYGSAIAYSFVSTLAIFITITAYCWWSKKDFSFLYGFIIAFFIAIVIAFIVIWFVDLFGDLSRWAWFGIQIAGALLVTAVLLFDCSQIVNKYPVDEYIQGAISLYVDFINLFLCLLGAFGSAG